MRSVRPRIDIHLVLSKIHWREVFSQPDHHDDGDHQQHTYCSLQYRIAAHMIHSALLAAN